MKAVVADPIGGPENLRYVDVPTPEPQPGEVLIKIEAIGVNFIDVYYRTGIYKSALTPVRLGSEAAGTVLNANGVPGFSDGQRVAYVMALGAYAEYATVPARFVVALPDEITFEQGAASLLQGMTAHYLTRSTYGLKSGDVCLVHAAAGGTGLLLIQMAHALGATVIGTVGTDQKAAVATQHGADHVIVHSQTDFVQEVKRLTDGKGVNVVYDSVGAATFHKSLDCLCPRGTMVSFGNASGPVEPFAPLLLTEKGSLFLTRPSLAHYVSDAKELSWRATDLFESILDGRLRINIHRTFALRDAAEAQRELESRRSSGKILLRP